MFTGIVECVGKITCLRRDQGNLHLTVSGEISSHLKIDQSVAHNGVCLTVVALNEETHTVTAIAETLSKTNLGDLQVGDLINLERCMKLNDRLDGHIVQGHVDTTATVLKVEDRNGSWCFVFKISDADAGLLVPKGSVTINGVSLTVVSCEPGQVEVAIIPYTFEHTNFHQLSPGNRVNIEYDVIGKYVARMMVGYGNRNSGNDHSPQTGALQDSRNSK